MKLNTIISGSPGDAPPVLLVHGLFGQARNLGGLARRLDDARQVISVDMRNHGDSPHDPDHSYPALAGDLARVIEAHGGVADVVGHSMGGKAAMTLALSRPELVRRLVVMDIAPVTYSHSQQEYIDAMQGMDLTGLKLRSDADKRLAAEIDDPGVRAFLLQSLDLKADPPEWKLNLDVLSDQMSSLTGWPDGLNPGAFDGPALFLAGAASDYAAEGPAADAIRRYFPQAELRYLDGCGHWIHAEKPKEVGEAVAGFLG
ncbi:Pimeloyl-ACP methyl ester carboxylesterase [Paracoccus isoporae]|uniref:Pimeloyl-ACP methyl ester carboxylesterase n=1 Tax=Paracoccus isoporae TaxID=591205 RepID=A0A1G7ETP1_9RHOB|nr:alpha/beta fold hydrolase [Paracoccus isoporae]SDE66947.1 Pimeloyl-ACP methyl ester carboxylesterase [Paracoccus isoporae]